MPPEDARTPETTEAATSSLDRGVLLKDLQKQVALLVEDLREREAEGGEAEAALTAEYQRALGAERTSLRYEGWLDERLVQIASAWVLACVFVRFCEDNRLVREARLAGPGERLAEAQDNHDAFFRRHPEKNDRDWLQESFRALGREHEITGGLFDPAHNPLWELNPSYTAGARLLAFWRERGADGTLRHDFTDPALDTRFLGDLYQDLSEHARKTYALLQTPDFVEEFILDLTLEPAVEEFTLEPVWKHRPVNWDGEMYDTDDPENPEVRGLRCIDPACGSGHFLLGLFRRILAKWREAAPGEEDWLLIRRSLEAVHGADKNPFAVAIARFRMLVAVVQECGVRTISAAPGVPINIAVADSLLHGREAGRKTDATLDDAERNNEAFTYRTEDVQKYVKKVDLLGRGSYHVVVANPPYITVKDPLENANYRKAYWTCSGKYALSVPFAQRIFELAVRAGGSHRDGGFTGQITANSFMKREFGSTLIQSFFQGGPYKDPGTRRTDNYAGVDLTHVIDTSGAFIPGHGTPTVILAGRHQMARQTHPIRAVLGVRGEPDQPEDPAEGKVWQAITEQWRRPGSESEWVSVEDAERGRFATFPWSLSGGGAGQVLEVIEGHAAQKLAEAIHSTGFHDILGEDDVFGAERVPTQWKQREVAHRPLAAGDALRDWHTNTESSALWPYREQSADQSLQNSPLFWPYRSTLRAGLTFGKTREDRGMEWHEHIMLSWDRTQAPALIAYGEVATHNHFVLDRGGKVFKQTAPVIKLPEEASEERHLELLGLLNSSVSCFWLKQMCHDKGIRGEGGGFTSSEWERFYQFNSTKLHQFPLPSAFPLSITIELDSLAQQMSAHEPSSVSATATPTRTALGQARAEQDRIRARMILLQEELDWTVYGLYGLLTPQEVERTTLSGSPDTLTDADVPQLALGQRAFEIALARSNAETAWFTRHHSTPTTEIPADWPASYRRVVEARLDLIAHDKDIRLIERPEFKRRWSTEPWEKREAAALRTWLLDAAERKDLWYTDREGFDSACPMTIYQLADRLRHDEDVQTVAALYAADHLGQREARLSTVLAAVIETEHVPHLAVLRYKESGLRKRAQWEEVWERQREEDRDGKRLDIKVPPKYTSADFLKHSYWSNRGKLDVPKERFISYPGSAPDGDPSLLIGWAGWDHREQAEALSGLITDRLEQNGWPREDPRYVPLLAGLAEVLPWVEQWYDAYDEDWGSNAAEEFRTALKIALEARDLSFSDLRDWRPEPKRRGRGAK
ncbi:BREX-2 system adenine-specific DNA-methyltransferase PglX [Streptomyces sp. NBC_00690]|uniref:BREX-2 system adenine-specific DNA-methyltransferase PglX n=1 Tax=Streptomyces sp. NBC_00690 TaxID=2975808 RepID=UPI002E2D39B8|nr:BREX-2 system adenine-specific DNA-methyltransferase PglX [Streptomyces sp. NBC_00690]